LCLERLEPDRFTWKRLGRVQVKRETDLYTFDLGSVTLGV